jgi:hypothetical protein
MFSRLQLGGKNFFFLGRPKSPKPSAFAPHGIVVVDLAPLRGGSAMSLAGGHLGREGARGEKRLRSAPHGTCRGVRGAAWPWRPRGAASALARPRRVQASDFLSPKLKKKRKTSDLGTRPSRSTASAPLLDSGPYRTYPPSRLAGPRGNVGIDAMWRWLPVRQRHALNGSTVSECR